jgi:hypothetical protein
VTAWPWRTASSVPGSQHRADESEGREPSVPKRGATVVSARPPSVAHERRAGGGAGPSSAAHELPVHVPARVPRATTSCPR